MKKFFRKIHLWLSIPLGIIISIICFSGAFLIFQDEINEITNRNKYFAKEVQGTPMPIDKLVRIINLKLEDNSITSIQIPSDLERNYIMGLQEGNRAFLYVDPYTGEIMGKTERGSGFFSIMLRLHRWLLDDSRQIGKPLVGYTTLFFVFILISGVVIWLPKNMNQLKTRFQIKTKYGQKRFLNDLHTTGGMYVAMGLLILALTGLNFSFDWYRSGFYKLFGADTSAMTYGHGNKPNDKSKSGNPNYKDGNGNPNYQKKEKMDIDSSIEKRVAPSERKQGGNPSYKNGNGNPNYEGKRGGNPNYNGESNRNLIVEEKSVEKTNNSEIKIETISEQKQGGNPNYRGGNGNPNYRGKGNPNYKHDSSDENKTDGNNEINETEIVDSLSVTSDLIKIYPANKDTIKNTRKEERGEKYPSKKHTQETDLKAEVDGSSVNTDDNIKEKIAGIKNIMPHKQVDPNKYNIEKSKIESIQSKFDTIEESKPLTNSIYDQDQSVYFAQWTTIVDSIKIKNPEFKTITIQNGSATVTQTFTFGNVRATDKYIFDNNTGNIKDIKLYENQDRETKVRGWVYSIHVGAWGGLFSKILTCLVALIGGSLPITGYYKYFAKRKRKSQKV